LVDWQVAFANHFFGASFNLTWRISTALLAGGVGATLTWLFGPAAHPLEWTFAAILSFTLLTSLTDDLGYFLFHWTCHSVPWLWAFHKVHHSAEVMTPITAARVHPLERAILGPFRAVTNSLIVGPALYVFMGEVRPAEIFGLGLFAFVFDTLGHVLHHSNIWVYYGKFVGRIIISPAQHQIHHSTAPQHWNRNFAEHWAIWDALFGTLYLPSGREELSFGLTDTDKQPHTNVLTAYLVPFYEAAYKLLAPIGNLLRLGARKVPGEQES
jgi:sterol desaturase/sphingolipid hydroxylase (fatty acid hydroxylase superfamily)